MLRLLTPAPARAGAGWLAGRTILAALLLLPAVAQAQREVASFKIGKHTSARVSRVAISPDGKFAAALVPGDGNEAEKRDHVRIYDLKANKQVRLFQTGTEGLSYIGPLFSYTPDGKKLVCSTSKGLYVFDPKTGEQLKAFEARVSPAISALSPDGKTAVCVADGELATYDLKTTKELFAIKTKAAGVRRLALSPDGRLAAVGEGRGVVRLFDLRAKKELDALPMAGRSSETVLAFSPDSKRLAACDDAARYMIIDLKTRKTLASLDMQILGYAVIPEGLAFTPDGKKVVAAGQGTGVGVYVWDLADNKVSGDRKVRANTHRSMALSADGKTLVVGDREVKVFTLSEEKKGKPKP